MKRIVRLTESDLVRLVKRVISEQPEDELRAMGWDANPNTDVFTIPEKVGSNYKSLFRGPYMSTYDGSRLVKALVGKGFVGYLKPIYLDDSMVTTQGMDRPGTNVPAATNQKRVAFQVKKPFKLNGENLAVNAFLNTCDSRTQDCPLQILQKVTVDIGTEQFSISLS